MDFLVMVLIAIICGGMIGLVIVANYKHLSDEKTLSLEVCTIDDIDNLIPGPQTRVRNIGYDGQYWTVHSLENEGGWYVRNDFDSTEISTKETEEMSFVLYNDATEFDQIFLRIENNQIVGRRRRYFPTTHPDIFVTNFENMYKNTFLVILYSTKNMMFVMKRHVNRRSSYIDIMLLTRTNKTLHEIQINDFKVMFDACKKKNHLLTSRC